MAEIRHIDHSPGVQDDRHSYRHSGNLPDANSKSLQLLGSLQTTLELNNILEMFNEGISAIVPHDGLSYTYEKHDCHFTIGTASRHRCTFELTLMDFYLGELVFYRTTRFAETETRQIETMIAALIYPLKNALLYRIALEKAHRDPLTGVNNRTTLDDTLTNEINFSRRHAVALSMIIFDIDHFKILNDTHGHITGDTALKRVAETMQGCLRDSDIIYRYGGEEFVVLLRHTKKRGARLLAERIRKAIELMSFSYEGQTVRVTVSAGVAAYRNKENAVDFLKRCDAALYEAKNAGRNCVVAAEA